MSFQKFMNKKDFHPGSFRNIKMAWEAEEKTRLEVEKQGDLRAQYDREQELYRNRQQMAGSSREKLQLNFMYDAPPGMRREDMLADEEEVLGEDGQPKLKLIEKKATSTSAVSSVAGESDTIGTKRHIQCYRCNKWGHANTDNICPLYNVPRDDEKFVHRADAMKLIREMRLDGFAMNPSLYGSVINVAQRSQELILSEDEDAGAEDTVGAGDMAAAVANLSKKQKRRLLRKLDASAGSDVNLSQLLAAAQAEDKKKKEAREEKRMKRKKTSSTEKPEQVRGLKRKSRRDHSPETPEEKRKRRKRVRSPDSETSIDEDSHRHGRSSSSLRQHRRGDRHSSSGRDKQEDRRYTRQHDLDEDEEAAYRHRSRSKTSRRLRSSDSSPSRSPHRSRQRQRQHKEHHHHSYSRRHGHRMPSPSRHSSHHGDLPQSHERKAGAVNR